MRRGISTIFSETKIMPFGYRGGTVEAHYTEVTGKNQNAYHKCERKYYVTNAAYLNANY